MANAAENCSDTTAVHPPINSLLDTLTFRLARLVAVNDHTGSHYIREALGLSLNEWRIIGIVHAFGTVPFRRVRRILMMDKGQLSRLVKGLTDRELVSAHPAASDARTVELQLTRAGRELHSRALPFIIQRNEVVVGTLSQQECRDFLRILEKITIHTDALSDLASVQE